MKPYAISGLGDHHGGVPVAHWLYEPPGGEGMPTYVILMNLTEQGVKTIKDAPARIEESTKAIEAAGGKLIGFYLTMGQ